MSARPGEHAPAARAAGRGASRPGPAPAQAARPWRDYWQLVPVALLMYALVAIDRFRRGAQAAGLVNAVTINRLSRPIGGRAALAMNHWLTGHPVPAAAAAAYYMVLQVLVTAAAGIWLFGSGHPSYRRHRDALVVTGVIGLVAFWVHPVAPRMLPGYHDTGEAIGPLFSHLLETKAADAFASFPSLHVTWALWVAGVGQDLLRRRIWRAAVWAYPAATTIDVLATANHYVLDAIAAPAVLAAGYGTVVALPALARHAHLPRRARLPRPPAAGPPESCTPSLAVGSSPNRVARGCRDVLLRAAADARAERPWAVPGRPARPSLKPASAHPKTCPVSRTPQTAAGHAASARSPPGPGVTGPAAPHGCSSVPFPVNHEGRGATVIAR